jgi:hypothetical protein
VKSETKIGVNYNAFITFFYRPNFKLGHFRDLSRHPRQSSVAIARLHVPSIAHQRACRLPIYPHPIFWLISLAVCLTALGFAVKVTQALTAFICLDKMGN